MDGTDSLLARVVADSVFAESLYRAQIASETIEAEGPDTGPKYVSANTCPFKCCVFGQWTFLSKATVRAAPDAFSDSIGTLVVGDTVKADSGRIVLQPTGLVVLLDSVTPGIYADVPFAAGDTVELLADRSEGYRMVRWRGRLFAANVDDWRLPTTKYRIVRRPWGGWWARVTHGSSGLQGWIMYDGVKADPMYSCG